MLKSTVATAGNIGNSLVFDHGFQRLKVWKTGPGEVFLQRESVLFTINSKEQCFLNITDTLQMVASQYYFLKYFIIHVNGC